MRKKRIIDNKPILLTDDEFNLHKQISRSLDNQTLKGEEFFAQWFESSPDGLIIFLHPPTDKPVSIQVFMWYLSVVIHQHVGQALIEVHEMRKEIEQDRAELKELLTQAKQILPTK